MEGQKRPQSTAREPSEDGFEVKKLINESRVWVLCLPFRYSVNSIRNKISKPLSLSGKTLSLSLCTCARGVDHHRLLSRIKKIASCCYGKREDSSRAAR